jgi:hypothetical protein
MIYKPEDDDSITVLDLLMTLQGFSVESYHQYYQQRARIKSCVDSKQLVLRPHQVLSIIGMVCDGHISRRLAYCIALLVEDCSKTRDIIIDPPTAEDFVGGVLYQIELIDEAVLSMDDIKREHEELLGELSNLMG